jgi:hypothetical protein
VTNILLILNMNTFYCRWFKRDITKKKSESLRFDWSVSAHRVSRYAGRDVILNISVHAKFLLQLCDSLLRVSH